MCKKVESGGQVSSISHNDVYRLCITGLAIKASLIILSTRIEKDR